MAIGSLKQNSLTFPWPLFFSLFSRPCGNPVNTSPRNCMQEIKKSYQTVFDKIGKKYQTAQFDFVLTAKTLKNDL